MMRSVESASSVFYHSQEEETGKTGGDNQGTRKDGSFCMLHDSYKDSDPGLAVSERDITGTTQSVLMPAESWECFNISASQSFYFYKMLLLFCV